MCVRQITLSIAFRIMASGGLAQDAPAAVSCFSRRGSLGLKKSYVEFRPTIASDLPHLTDKPLPFRIRAMTALIDGNVHGVGGIGFMPDGTVVGLAQMTNEMRKHKFALHRMAVKFLADLKQSGIRELVTLADTTVAPSAENWLRHLGFEPVERNGVRVFLWQTR
jgi:hypothetical protein